MSRINKKYGFQHQEHCKMKDTYDDSTKPRRYIGKVFKCEECKHLKVCGDGLMNKQFNEEWMPVINKALKKVFK